MPRKSAAVKEAKRRTVAKAAIAGKGTRVTARAARCTTRHVQRLLKEPKTQFLITETLRPHQKKLAKLATKVITAVEKALAANEGDKADHIARLRAVERYGDLLELAQGKVTESEESTVTWTWEQFCQMFVEPEST